MADVVWGTDLDWLQLCLPLGMVIVRWLRKGYWVFCSTLEVFAQFMTSRGDCHDSILPRFLCKQIVLQICQAKGWSLVLASSQVQHISAATLRAVEGPNLLIIHDSKTKEIEFYELLL